MEQMFVACLCLYPGIYWRNWGKKKSSSSYLRTIKLITKRLCTFGIPDGSQRVLGFAYKVIPMYYCIYVYIGVTCVLFLRAVFLWGPGYVRRGLFSCFTVSGGWGGGAYPRKNTTDITRTPIKEQRPQESAHTSPQYTRRYNSRY